MSNDYPTAKIIEVDGQLALHDPQAVAVIVAVRRENCRRFIEVPEIAARVKHFVQRIADLGKTGAEYLIVLLNVNDARGAQFADVLMPGHDWDEVRRGGKTPYARGLVERAGVQMLLDENSPRAGHELRAIEGVAVLVVDFETICAFGGPW